MFRGAAAIFRCSKQLPIFRHSKQLPSLSCRFYSVEKFEAAQQKVTTLKEEPDNDIKLKLYALFKQGSNGDVEGEEPSLMDFVKHAKYNAWADLKGLSTEDAQKQYAELVEELLEEEKKG